MLIINRNKKAQELSLEKIVIFIIVIIVLFIVIYFFSNSYSNNSDTIFNVANSSIDSAKNYGN